MAMTSILQRKSPFLVLAVAACSGGGDEAATIQRSVSVPAKVQSTVACQGGTNISISGGLVLDGLGAHVVMRNNEKGTHERSDELGTAVVLIPPDQTLDIATQTVDGKPVADPVISIQVLDAGGNAISAEVVLGTCDGVTLTADATALIPAEVALSVSAAGCSNSPGPTITLEGEVSFSGLQHRVIVRDGVGGAIAGEATTNVDIVALEDGGTLSVPKQPVRGGVGGNPWIYLQLRDLDGGDLTEEILLGRCVQLSQEAE
jgi:hypothetical protein